MLTGFTDLTAASLADRPPLVVPIMPLASAVAAVLQVRPLTVADTFRHGPRSRLAKTSLSPTQNWAIFSL